MKPPVEGETLRARAFRQLDMNAWTRPGISPLNGMIVLSIVGSIVAAALMTEPSLDPLNLVLRPVLAGFALLFTAEYVLRWWTRWEDPEWRRGPLGPWAYGLTTFAIVDLFALVGVWLEVLGNVGIGWAVMLRVMRLARIFTLDRHTQLGRAAHELATAIRARSLELGIAITMAGALLMFFSVAMYLAERHAQPEIFGSIPRAVWWAVVTMTTVGYGDAYPVTGVGKIIATFAAFSSIGLIAVPAGIMAAAFSDAVQKVRTRDHHERRRR
ncbi:MAG: ion transporter [Pseudomonadota bacterium]